MRLPLAISLLGMLALVSLTGGCGENDPFDTDEPRRGPATGLGGSLAPADLDGQDETPKPPPEEDQTNASEEDAPPLPEPANTTDDQTQPTEDPNTDRVEAGVGVETKKGHGYGTGPVATPLTTYFRAQEHIQLLQVQQAMQHFKALNGRAPKSHEEFMQKIIKENGVQLPELESPEHRYVYDPETETLMVERPR